MKPKDTIPSLFDLPVRPDYSGELKAMADGARFVAGVDEVGRGPLAGPVVTAAVILNPDDLPHGLDDSKRLTCRERERLYDVILQKALAISFASLCARAIDRSDIRKAALEAMRRAVEGLALKPSFVLVDGRDIPPGLACPAAAWVKGDQRSLSIAAASIVAKVLRDKMMAQAGKVYPAYGFEKHAGYATLVHRRALLEVGPVAKLHRFSFAPVRGRWEDETE